MTPRWLAAATTAVLLAASACASEDPVDSGPTPPPVREAVWNSCTNPAGAYAIDYPQEWHTNDADGLEPCRVFDPEPVELAERPQEIAITHGVIIGVEDVAFGTFTSADAGFEVIDEEQVEVDLQRAVRQELVATGQGLYPEGTELTRYAVDRNGETLVAQTFKAGELPYQRKVQVLDEMMSELEFLEGG